MLAYNGRITAKQEVLHIRRNQPHREVPYGEYLDDSKGWGKATKAGIIIRPSESIVVDNGKFQSEDTFASMFTKTKIGNETRYNHDSIDQLGKYNAGATDSTIILGNIATAYTNLNGVIKKTTFDVNAYERDNKIPSNSSECTEEEIADYIAHMKHLVPYYELSPTSGGTVIKIGNLTNINRPYDVNKLIKFCKGLYIDDHTEDTIMNIKIYDYVRNSGSMIETSIEPVDTTFGAIVEKHKIFVFENKSTGERKHVEDKSLDTSIWCNIAKYSIHTWKLNKAQFKKETEYYGNTRDEDMVGFNVYRKSRRITHAPKRWGLSTGMNRARRIRIAVFLPASDIVDEIFGIGTQKLLTNESWSGFSESHRKLFGDLFGNIQKTSDKLIRQAQKVWIEQYQKHESEINTLSLETANDELGKARQDFTDNFDKEDGIIKRRAGRAYKAYKSYEKKLEEHINFLETENNSEDEELQEEDEELQEEDEELQDEDEELQEEDEDEELQEEDYVVVAGDESETIEENTNTYNCDQFRETLVSYWPDEVYEDITNYERSPEMDIVDQVSIETRNKIKKKIINLLESTEQNKSNWIKEFILLIMNYE
jgi:hypothetical protein